MSSSSPATSAPKAMSSRLLTMKFMQRAAASPSSSSPTTPDEPPNKRRKKESDTSPSKFNVDALADQRAIQKALANEEAKRQAALEKQAAEAGDTRWVLSFEDQQQAAASSALALRVVQTGYANLDNSSALQVQAMEEEPEDKAVVVGRRSYGKFNKVLEKQQDPTAEDSPLSDSDEDEQSNNGDESDDDDPSKGYYNDSRASEAADRLRKQRKAEKQREKSALLKHGKDRKKKEVNLNGLTSLSGKVAPQRGPCHHCGGPHFKRECPELSGGGGEVSRFQKRGFQGGDDGPPRKTVRAR